VYRWTSEIRRSGRQASLRHDFPLRRPNGAICARPYGPASPAGVGAGSLTLRWAAASHYLTGPHERARALRAILDEVAAGRFSPRIAGRFPLGQASQAHALLASRTVSGKLLLEA